MGKRLFVGGLPYSITDQQLKDLFSEQGQIESVTIVTDRYSGQSKGFGFVEMVTEEDAQKAIATLNNTELEGRKIVVNEARPREDRPQRSFGDRSGGMGRGSDRGGGFRRNRSGRW